MVTAMKPKPALMQLDDLMAHAERYATFLMRKNGRVPPTLFAATPKGGLCYVPHDLADARAKDNFANAARLICAAYAATSVVMVVEGWVTTAILSGLPAFWDWQKAVFRRESRRRWRSVRPP
jgi:hypothetical protein